MFDFELSESTVKPFLNLASYASFVELASTKGNKLEIGTSLGTGMSTFTRTESGFSNQGFEYRGAAGFGTISYVGNEDYSLLVRRHEFIHNLQFKSISSIGRTLPLEYDFATAGIGKSGLESIKGSMFSEFPSILYLINNNFNFDYSRYYYSNYDWIEREAGSLSGEARK